MNSVILSCFIHSFGIFDIGDSSIIKGGGIVDDPALKLGSKRRVGLVTDMGNVA